ncbi:MAG: nitrate- and nitrite sensing domain-containing protein [Streptosporangiales bacterium]|nr:nitrate- and nitrite sensing domain-containing protein [Streptosporangiales bacterium]
MTNRSGGQKPSDSGFPLDDLPPERMRELFEDDDTMGGRHPGKAVTSRQPALTGSFGAGGNTGSFGGGSGFGGGPGGSSGRSNPNLPVPARRDAGRVDRGSSAALTVGRQGGRFALHNWRVRWRLFAIIALPTIAALVFGLVQIVSAGENYESFARVQSLANLNSLVVQGVTQLTTERDTIAGFVAQGKPASEVAKVNAVQHKTDETLNKIQQQAAGIDSDSSIRPQTVLDLKNGVLAGVNDLTFIRSAALKTQTPAVAVIQVYDERLISPFITFSNDIAAGTGNSTLQTDVTVLNSLLRMEDDASLQRAYLYQGLLGNPPQLTPVALKDLQQASAQQQADANQFGTAASVEESQNFNNTVSGQPVDEAQSEEERAIASAGTGGGVQIGNQQTCTGQSSADCWFGTQSAQIGDIQKVIDGSTGQQSVVSEIQSQASSLVNGAADSAILISVLVIALIIIVIMITVIVARSMIRPLRKLRADALEIAGTKLPEMVRRLSESQGGDEGVEIEPIGVSSSDEIGEVARAFDQVHREAVRLAADEAMMRGNLNAMFVNLARRSQSLIERQLSMIDGLEQSEQDPDRLSSLFRLDHLATRMRRNSENLLVLAGHETARRWSQPVPMVDVLRAAVSEIEQFERVVLNVQPGIQVVGQAVNDIVHLVAEIVENATTFSPEDTQVHVTGQPLTSGGVLLDITDNGVGISEQEMAHANWRLDNPPVVDVAVSRRMGLFVVGRLANRHGVRVRLRHAQSGGLTALIWLPESVAAPDGKTPQGLGQMRNFEESDYGPAPSLSAPPLSGGPSAPPSGFGAPAPSSPGLGGPGGPASSPGAPAPSVPGGLPQRGGGTPAGGGGAAGRMTRMAPNPGEGGDFGGLNSLSGPASSPGAPAPGVPGGLPQRGAGAPGGELPSRGGGDPVRGAADSTRLSSAMPRLSPGLPRADDGDFGGDSSGGSAPLPVRQPGRSSGGPRTGAPGDGGSFFTPSGSSPDEDGSAGGAEPARPAAFGGAPAPGIPGALPARGGNAPGSDLPSRGDGAPGGGLPTRTPGAASGGPGTMGGPGGAGAAVGSDGSSVSVPPSVGPGNEPRLPIFDSLETDWFRAASDDGEGGNWGAVADQGWQAAQVAAAPNADETTEVGLPKRKPRANLVPGSVGGDGAAPPPPPPPPARSAEQIRNRMSSFQRGVRDARAAAPQSEEP